MKKKAVLISLLATAILPALLVTGCGQGDVSPPMGKMERGLTEDEKAAPTPAMKKDSPRSIDRHFLAEMDKAGDRYLEYHVHLTYKTDDFTASRHGLLDIVQKYGFMEKATTSKDTERPVLTSVFRVKNEELYSAIKDCDTLGVLVSEKITVTDHTPDMVYQEIKREREEKRIQKKERALKDVKQGEKSWREVQESLEQSENELDRQRFEKWKIEDRVTWSTLQVTLEGPILPSKPVELKLPSFRNALVEALQIILYILYTLVALLPLILLAGLAWYFRGYIKRFFKRGAGQDGSPDNETSSGSGKGKTSGKNKNRKG
jgi:hypothetical protein